MIGNKVGAVLVVGGGIGGIQASLDLADSGFKVYLVESQSGIGGRMAQLDKTYPTNDCSTCIFSPKLLQAGQNPNIEILTYSEVEDVRGWEGHFKVKIHQKARYVREDRCKGCGDCAAECPVRFSNQFDQNLSDRGAIYRLFPQTIPQTFVIDKAERAPCVRSCPANVNVQGYVQLVKQGRYNEAVELMYEKIALPGVLGRVCPHPCEDTCRRLEKDQAVSICKLKRFATDHADYSLVNRRPAEQRDEKVAIVGSGPAGLAAAYYLARQGFQARIFEASPVLGGWLRLGIPEFRLPRTVLERDILHIMSLGVTAQTNAALGRDFTLDDLKSQGFKATFIAVGCQHGAPLAIPGIYTDGVVQGVDLLRRVALGTYTETFRRPVVVGGGNVAIDTARTLVRLGAEQVTVLYRRSRGEMPAYAEEVDAAHGEGIHFEFLAAPVAILTGNGRVNAVKCIRMALGPEDDSGRRRPVPIEGSEFVLDVDGVFPAIGQTVDAHIWQRVPGIGRTDRDTIHINRMTYATILPGVFAAGDVVTQPATVVKAVAGGREAAESISRYLKGEDLFLGRLITFSENPVYPPIPDVRSQLRTQPKMSAAAERLGFKETELTFSDDEAHREANRCFNCGLCSECMECVKACSADAVDHAMSDSYRDVEVGTVILSTGYDLIDPTKVRGEFSYGIAANVLTNMEFERMLSASGPYNGEVKRPSDEKHPRKVAWIQCVGSRDPQKGMPHCSAICCMASIKEAVIAREHDAGIQPTIFFMDMRAAGKDFEAYYERAMNEGGVRFIRSMVSRVVEDPASKDLQLTYIDENQRPAKENFDMVVLAVGLKAGEASRELAEKLGVQLDEIGFCATSSFEPVKTSRDGVYAIGMFQGPKDIPGTVVQASAAAGASCRLLAPARNSLTTVKELPPERDMAGQIPRIGVFVCRCGINIASTVDVPEVVRRARHFPRVAYAGENLFTCSQDAQVNIKRIIEEHELNRVVIASCTPRTHLAIFQNTAREAGLNRYLVEMANIREHCSWVHMDQKERATEKAVDLVRMAVARAGKLEPVWDQQLPMIQSALVVGGGVAGMVSALNIASQGFSVHLVEATDKLGGNALRLFRTIRGEEVQPFVQRLVETVTSHDAIEVHFNSRVEDVKGFIGKFSTRISGYGDQSMEIEHGVAVLATGATEWKPNLYGYGSDPRIRTHLEMSEVMRAGDPAVMKADTTVFIQCVGSRCEERPWCSKVCCNHSVTDAIALKEANPEANVFVLYRDIRTYGLNEPYYEQARRMGVIFVRYEPEHPPVVESGKRIRVQVRDLVLGGTMTVDADSLVLASAIVPRENNKELARLFKVSTHADGSYLEAHMKLRPVDFATDGVFLAGLAHHPKPLDETIAQAEATGCHAASCLARGFVEVPGTVSVIDRFLCRGCGRCVEACPYQAPQLTEVVPGVAVSEVNPALCKGCGACGVVCPTGAAQIRHFKDDQIADMIDAALAGEPLESALEDALAEEIVEAPAAAQEVAGIGRVEELSEADEAARVRERLRYMIETTLRDERARTTLNNALGDDKLSYILGAALRDERVRYMVDVALKEEPPAAREIVSPGHDIETVVGADLPGEDGPGVGK
ncbi:MAG: FAD-dependent oxidoreductase [Desulfomonile tiedjei]|nr:FAD-dependent oxidoreductase [Desulfomonile tiedjei]